MAAVRQCATAIRWEKGRCWLMSMGLALLALLAGCGSTEWAIREQESALAREKERAKRETEFQSLQAAESRAWDVLEPLMREAANYHESETYAHIGAVFVTERFYPDRLRREARAAGFGPYISIAKVFPGSPAELAGLRPGDRLISINGRSMPRWDRAARFASAKVKRLLRTDKMNKMVISRGGEIYKLEVEAQPAAYYAVIVAPGQINDLRADGEVVWLNLDLVERVEDADQFAYACAFALAQNVMKHPEKRRKNQWVGQLIDIAAQTGGITTTGVLGNLSGRRFHWAFTVEADLIALYLLAANGHDISKYPDFWHKQLLLASREGGLERRDSQRIEIMHRVIESIESKKREGRFIFPEEYLSGDTYEIRLDEFADNAAKLRSTYSN